MGAQAGAGQEHDSRRTFFLLEILSKKPLTLCSSCSPLHGGFLRPSSVPPALAPTPLATSTTDGLRFVLHTEYGVTTEDTVHDTEGRSATCVSSRSSGGAPPALEDRQE